jgi:hypothetical protein
LLAALALTAMVLKANFLIVLVGTAVLAIPLYRFAGPGTPPAPEVKR